MSESLTKLIKSKAIELGFSKIGIAKSEELIKEGAQLREWLIRGYQASMEWMASDVEKRIGPMKILPEAKSVICLAMNYFTVYQHSKDLSVGKISRYAWGDDYHNLITGRLEELLKFIKTYFPQANGKLYVDTGPMMEKAWAMRAGIGWQGKHTNIITREFGSWIFLGEILLDVELAYDKPISDFCGTCSACIKACPTGAIIEPYVLDSNRCISYLTIEHHGDLPKKLAQKFNNWIFGCDICQDVCPWNRFAKETNEKVFQPRFENIAPSLKELNNLNQEEFLRRFHRSPIKRTKLKGLIRNAKAVLESGNCST
jgi:epoxyqueuosine reductase